MKEVIVQLTGFDYEDEKDNEYLYLTVKINKSEIKEVIDSRILRLGDYFLLKSGTPKEIDK